MADNDRSRDELDLEEPLGIARQPVEPDEHIRAGRDPKSVRRRRNRALGPRSTDQRTIPEPDDPGAATGVDLGGWKHGPGVKGSSD